jgi:hypothetical protein
MELIKWLLDYVATNPEAILTNESSDMIQAVHSDASYHSKANASAVIFSAPPTSVIHPTMEPSSTSPKYSRPSCPVQPKQN